MLIDKIKFCVYDNYYKNIDNVESYLISNNLIKLFNVDSNTLKVNYNSINAYENTDIQSQLLIFENCSSSFSIKSLKSSILYLESSIELVDNCWFAIMFF